MPGLWRYHGGLKGVSDKYLVVRRDGTVLEHPSFTLVARDPAAPTAIRAYADVCRELGMDRQYVDDLGRMADEFDAYRQTAGDGDPDAPRHRTDDPRVISAMRIGVLQLPEKE